MGRVAVGGIVITDQLPPAVSHQDAAHALFFFRGEGLEPGSFTSNLQRAYCAGDPTNRGRLLMGFPGLCFAMEVGLNHPEGLDLLRSRFKEGYPSVVPSSEH